MPVLSQDTSLLLTTSGSTGVPNLVRLGGAGVDAFTSWAGTRPHVVQAVPMFFRPLTEAGTASEFPGVRELLLTGDHVPRSVRAGLSRLFPAAKPRTETYDRRRRRGGPRTSGPRIVVRPASTTPAAAGRRSS
ncbi:hypothetical protein [Streptomyces kaempferi]|uniref:AMP-binding enzyme n=1 Tax=Streptomyces kaempferi TaxID=333725 RepID=A0ABW3XSD6_9ACTN